MSLVVYAEASAGINPGHMIVGQEPAGLAPTYYGYRFDPADLPAEVRSPEHWQTWLFSHAIPGHIVDETAYVNHLLRVGERTWYEKRADCDGRIEAHLPPRDEWRPHAWYSFRPDDPHPGHQPCYNCVKWGIMIANSLVDGFLPAGPQGRLKLILQFLQKRPT